MATSAPTYESLCRAIEHDDLAPVVLLHGEEGYYLDELVKRFEALLPEADRDYGLTVMYAPDTDALRVADVARQLPMMCPRQVVIVKEVQAVGAAWVGKLAKYAASPNPATVLVLCARGDVVKNKDFLAALKASGGIVFTAAKVRDYQLPALIADLIKSRGMSADPKAMTMLQEYIGADLSRLYNEISKLSQILGAGARITPEAVERNVGVSKDYNSYELVDAIAAKDFGKMMRIAAYFGSNPKASPLQMVIPAVFGLFSDMLVAIYAKDRTDAGLAAELGLNPKSAKFALARLRNGMKHYNAFQIIEIIDAIRTFDAMSKGSGSRQDATRLFHDLMFRIASAPGKLPV